MKNNLITKDDYDKLNAVLESGLLNAWEEEVIGLFLDGWEQKEIAENYGIKRTTFFYQFQKILEKIRQAYEEME